VQIKKTADVMSSIASQINFPTRPNASVCRQHEQINYHAERASDAAVLARAPIVFVIDHDATNARCIETLLFSQGYAVRAFDSAAAFLRSIDASTPGCVLLNLRLPDATGLAVQTYLAATGRAQPVVFVANGGTVGAAVQAIKGGAEDFIEMPFEEPVLIGAVERAIERDRRQRARRLEKDLYAARLELLTPRERQVLGHVIAGRLNKRLPRASGPRRRRSKCTALA
jgi:FixJ family two-component response regulator